LAIEITMMNKKGEVGLKDIIIMLLLFSGIIALASVFVQEMGGTYDNINMTSSYNQNTIGNESLTTTSNKFADLGNQMKAGGLTGIWAGVRGVFLVFVEVLKAPVTFVTMMTSVLEGTGLVESEGIITTINLILSGILYVVIIFAISAAIMQRSVGI
jgi:hypothetical protein